MIKRLHNDTIMNENTQEKQLSLPNKRKKTIMFKQ